MEIRYMDRTAFRLAREDRFRGLATGDPDHLLVPEGGFGLLGAAGAAGILAVTDTSPYTHLCCACGTGTMLAGIIRSSQPGQRCIGVDVVRQGPALDASVRELLTGTDTGNWETLRGYEIGGYARYTEALTVFMNRFHAEQGIPSDIVYTGKLFLAMEDMLAKGFFPPGSRILAIHSGGLQGNRSLIPGTLSF
jgi:1-aminocyclopropane-1-carboxylate deaminase